MRISDWSSDVCSSDLRVIVDGGADPAADPIWIEGPHLFRKDGYYYLIAAEGGTAENHSEVVFRADAVTGPYGTPRSEEHTSELQSLMRISYAVFCLKKKHAIHPRPDRDHIIRHTPRPQDQDTRRQTDQHMQPTALTSHTQH